MLLGQKIQSRRIDGVRCARTRVHEPIGWQVVGTQRITESLLLMEQLVVSAVNFRPSFSSVFFRRFFFVVFFCLVFFRRFSVQSPAAMAAVRVQVA